MFVVTIDQRHSRRSPDRVPEILAGLARIEAQRPFERTAGDEVQGLLSDPAAALAAALVALEQGDWKIGIGIGAVERPLGASVRECRGPAFIAARVAVTEAGRGGYPPVAVRCAGRAGDQETGDAEAVLHLVGREISGRNRGQWRVVRAVRETPHATQRELAERLGITQQSVSESLRTSGYREEAAAYGVIERLLRVADLPSDRVPVPRGKAAE